MSKRGFFALNDDNFWGNGIDKGDDQDSDGEEGCRRDRDDETPPTTSTPINGEKAGEWIDVRDKSSPRPQFRRAPFDSTRAMEAHAQLLSKKDFTALEVLNALCRDSSAPLSSTNGSPTPPPTRPSISFTPCPQSADASGFGAGLGRFKRASHPSPICFPMTNHSPMGVAYPMGGFSGGNKSMGNHPMTNNFPMGGFGMGMSNGNGMGSGRGMGGFNEGMDIIDGEEEEMEHELEKSLTSLSVHSMGDNTSVKDSFNYRRTEEVAVPFTSGQRAAVNLMDEKYVEYYEYLCQGINRLLESGLPINIDCETRLPHVPFNSNVCRALKSKYYHQYSPGPEIYSRKVFVGGLPIDIDEDELVATFSSFGPLVVDWPNKNETKSYFPPKGYVFLIFEYEVSVRSLVQNCFIEDEKLFLYISSPLSPEKLVQIRPWRLADAEYLVDVNVPINPRRVVFVGGVPRPIRAVELAHIMDRLYGSVSCAGIDTDVEYKYPKGAGRVAFTNYNSYMRAITDRYAQLSHGEVEKRVEMKPYVLDDQICEECGGRHAPFFCPHMECLQYYCENCWTQMHGCPSREDHKPLVKEA